MPWPTPLNAVQPGAVPAESLPQINRVRAALIAGECLILGLTTLLLDARLPWLPLAVILAAHVLLWLGARHHACHAEQGLPTVEAALHFSADAALIASVVYFTGGYANPFIFLLLTPLILGAVLLPPRQAWALAAWVGLLYTALMGFYQPLHLEMTDGAAVHLHLLGMWLNFLLTSILVAAFVGRLATALRQRDAALATVREQRLRDEHLFALGLQAATAAHELATPLASLRLHLDTLRTDYRGDDELAPPLAIMYGQTQRMAEVLQRLGEAARNQARPAGAPLPAHAWLTRTLERWGLLHPQANVRLEAEPDLPALQDDPGLESALVNLLNNAAEAAPDQTIRIAASVEGNVLWINVHDCGAGLGRKPTGWGVGIALAQAALERLGGNLIVSETPGQGVSARISVPLAPEGCT